MEGLVVEWMEHTGRGLERSQWAPSSAAEAAKKPQTHQAAADSGHLPQGNHRAAFGAVFNPDQIRLLGSSYWEASPKQVGDVIQTSGDFSRVCKCVEMQRAVAVTQAYWRRGLWGEGLAWVWERFSGADQSPVDPSAGRVDSPGHHSLCKGLLKSLNSTLMTLC